jgi:hypothetical protein
VTQRAIAGMNAVWRRRSADTRSMTIYASSIQEDFVIVRFAAQLSVEEFMMVIFPKDA